MIILNDLKMKASVFVDTKQIEYRENYPKPKIGSDDALVKVHYCGICGSDLTNFRTRMYQVPIIMGHEFAGEIVEVGDNISDFKKGDRCLGITVQLDIEKSEFKGLGIFNDGGFAEYCKVPKEFLFHLPDSISYKEGTMVESFAVAVRAMKLSRISEKQNIAIIGAGNIGLTTLSVLLAEKKPNYIICIEPHEFLRNKALELGATEAFPTKMYQIKKFFKKHEFPNYIFECSGNDRAFKMALKLVKKGGSIILEGMYRGAVSIPLLLINMKEIGIKGVISHTREDIEMAIDLVARNKVDPDKFISNIVCLKDIQETFLTFLNPGERKFVKNIVKIIS
ncbi:MAG: alcohol dehydrogenase catalytic domain-containing protein [Candidatus Lokiarchaeota archaeon]|nr:alcohol dehydrogenase catalytic domain-containing protein [Candidatus Lokiarchaeota archaeon]